MITKLKETLGIIKANPIKCIFIIIIIIYLIIYLLTLCLNFDIADLLNLTAKTSDKCNYLAKEQLIIKTQNINKSQNLTTIIDINNNCNSSNPEKQIIAKRDLTKLQDYIAIFATFFVAIAIFIIESQKHQLKSLDKIIIERVLNGLGAVTISCLVLFLFLFYHGNSIYWSNSIIFIFIFYTRVTLYLLSLFYKKTRNQANTISDLKAPEQISKVWQELLQPETINKLSNQEIDSLLENSFVKHCEILDLHYKDYSQKRRLRSFLINDKVMNCLIDCHPSFVAIMNFYENEKDTYFKDHYQELFNAAFAKNEQKSLNLLRALTSWLGRINEPRKEEVLEYYFDRLLENCDNLKNCKDYEVFILAIKHKINLFSLIIKCANKVLLPDISDDENCYDDNNDDYKKSIDKLKSVFFLNNSDLLILLLSISRYFIGENLAKMYIFDNNSYYHTIKKIIKFFEIFYEVFEQYNKNIIFSDQKEEEKEALIKGIPTEIIDKILDSLIFFTLVKNFFNWQKSLLEKEEKLDNNDFYKIYPEIYQKYISQIIEVGLSYDSENYKQKIFIKYFEDYSNKIFDYCSEIYKEEKTEGRQQDYKKIYNKYKNILFPPQS